MDDMGYYLSPMMYGQNAIVMNEFLDERWSKPNTDSRIDAPTVGKALLKSRGFFTEEYWFWICIGALLGFYIIFNLLFILCLTYLNNKLHLLEIQKQSSWMKVTKRIRSHPDHAVVASSTEWQNGGQMLHPNKWN